MASGRQAHRLGALLESIPANYENLCKTLPGKALGVRIGWLEMQPVAGSSGHRVGHEAYLHGCAPLQD